MTVPRSTFLGRLAPSAALPPQAVRAALPARYAIGGGSPAIDETFEPTASQDSSPRLGLRELSREAEGAGVRPAAADRAPASSAPEPLTRPLPEAVRPSPSEPLSLAQPSAGAVPKAASNQAGHALPADRPPVPATETVVRPEGFPPRLPPSTDPRRSALQVQRGPLQPATVMERALGAQRAEPDVVQVTIDRIDVRMPPESSDPASRAQPRRRPEPTISLGDYLRRADSGPVSRG